MRRTIAVVVLAALALLASLGYTSLAPAIAAPTRPLPAQKPPPSKPTATVAGYVQSGEAPVEGARVRIQATTNETRSDAEGFFVLEGLAPGQPVTVTASAPGHYIGWTAAMPGDAPAVITLNRHYETDNFAYEWFEEDGVQGSAACGACHTSYTEWLADGHSQSATNPRFLSMYLGTDVHGNESPPVAKNNLGVPLPPDLTKTYHGPGFKLDFPNIAGNCATCHTPMGARIANAQNCGWSGCHKDSTASFAGQVLDPGVSPVNLSGDAAEGISCEFCHKIGQVYLDRKTGLPYPDKPGILSLRLYRPKEGHDLIFGPVDDIARTDVPEPRDVYSPLQKESAYCAGCHYGILGGVVVGNMETKGGVLVYSSFKEWLESPYSDEETGKTCQDCHMRTGDYPYFAWPAQGGVTRDPAQVHNHQMLGEELLQSALTLTATTTISDGRLQVDVGVRNEGAGHHVPTDSPLRHVMLVVEAVDRSGRPLPLQAGPTLPEWTGDYAGAPGRAFAKLLKDEWTGEMPTGAIWRPVTIAEDTRLPAHAEDASTYAFDAPRSGPATVKVQLIYRKAFAELMAWKAWSDPDVVMAEMVVDVPARGE